MDISLRVMGNANGICNTKANIDSHNHRICFAFFATTPLKGYSFGITFRHGRKVMKIKEIYFEHKPIMASLWNKDLS
ncbi:hypothetical protein ED236_02025 [Pseudomethylobacillus aquaticus]|uniref:Uncharacterized protein n=1 Tax=Pseudomethylobacillus aquaticus TaxID=2676064 RepID=A0A3N0V652_9PROT|nr:hypothetical protein [Pseudomethylobacillus aquaticus]ROH88266.1 hypothetical protein ED236_02025 [Pseudomethylobacillus aquaticus]